VDQITVRRWVPAAPTQVWKHLFDLQRVAVDDPDLDLEHLVDEGHDVPSIGAVATVRRRHGHRIERVELHVDDRVEPAHLAVTVSASGERWLLSIDVAELPGGGSDVRFHAERDPVGILRRDRRAGARAAQGLGQLLDGLARQLDRSSSLQPV
jgi:hypothetical protein